jgi:uncharacterized membrane protein
MRTGLVLIGILFLLLAMAAPAAAEYYADVVISVDASGAVRISGLTNHPGLAERETQEFTSKRGANWLLNITLEGNFSSFVYELRFPGNAQISYLKVPNKLNIGYESGQIVVTGTGNQEAFYVVAQYSFGPQESYSYMIIMGLAVAAVAAFLYAYRTRKPKPKYDTRGMTERQKLIFEFVRRAGHPVSQVEIERSVNIPKSSVSRNVDTLVRKGFLARQRRGMSNVVYLK